MRADGGGGESRADGELSELCVRDSRAGWGVSDKGRAGGAGGAAGGSARARHRWRRGFFGVAAEEALGLGKRRRRVAERRGHMRDGATAGRGAVVEHV